MFDQLTQRKPLANPIGSQQDWENCGNSYIFPTSLELYTIRVNLLDKLIKSSGLNEDSVSGVSDQLMEELLKFTSDYPEQWSAHQQCVQYLVARGCQTEDISRYRRVLDSQRIAGSSNRCSYLGELYLSCSLLSSDSDLFPVIQLIEYYIIRFGHKLVCASDLKRPLDILFSYSSPETFIQLKDFERWCSDRVDSLLFDIESTAENSTSEHEQIQSTTTTTVKSKSKGKQKAGQSPNLSPQTQLEQYVEIRTRKDSSIKSKYDLLGSFVTISRVLDRLSLVRRDNDPIASPVSTSTLIQVFLLGRKIKVGSFTDQGESSDTELLPSDELLSLIESHLEVPNQLSLCLLAQKIVPKNLQWTVRGIQYAISLGAGKLVWQQYLHLGIKHVQHMTIAPLIYSSIIEVSFYHREHQ